MHVYMHAGAYTYIHAWKHTCIHAYILTHVQTYIYIYTYTRANIHTCALFFLTDTHMYTHKLTHARTRLTFEQRSLFQIELQNYSSKNTKKLFFGVCVSCQVDAASSASRACMSHFTHMNESCRTYERVMSHTSSGRRLKVVAVAAAETRATNCVPPRAAGNFENARVVQARTGGA